MRVLCSTYPTTSPLDDTTAEHAQTQTTQALHERFISEHDYITKHMTQQQHNDQKMSQQQHHQERKQQQHYH